MMNETKNIDIDPGKCTKSSNQLSQESLGVEIVANGRNCHQTPPVQKLYLVFVFEFVFFLLASVVNVPTPHLYV